MKTSVCSRMRLRKIAGADEAVAKHEKVLKIKEFSKEEWVALTEEKELYLEIGMGKGDFLLGMAEKYPERFFLGMEKYSSVLLKALQKYDKIKEQPDNLRFLWENAMELSECFAENSLDGIYLNFSDPWPKERYAKRRLTAEGFLQDYQRILKPGKKVEMKTDNENLFRFSLESFENSPYFEIEKVYWDLHQEIRPEENVMTEYERKFAAKGNPIYKLIAVRKQKAL